MGTNPNTMPQERNSYVSSGDDSSEEDSEDESYGTIRRPSKTDDDGSMRISKCDKDSTPAFMKHIQNKKNASPQDFTGMSVEELKELKRQLISQKAQKIQEIRDKYKKLQLPVE